MYEKVNPAHPDKIADRIAGALVDLAYKKQTNPKVAIEVLIGHGHCYIVGETSVNFTDDEINAVVLRIAGLMSVCIHLAKQDKYLARNQMHGVRCGDNGIFKGMPLTQEETELSKIARRIYARYNSDGKYIINDNELIICQSNVVYTREIECVYGKVRPKLKVNPIGFWRGGTDVDTGATNRKLGSDMGEAVTGGGLHGKDLSKADVSVNIYAHLKAQHEHRPVLLSCAIGDETIDGRPYAEIVNIAKSYIDNLGGFERLAEWGIV